MDIEIAANISERCSHNFGQFSEFLIVTFRIHRKRFWAQISLFPQLIREINGFRNDVHEHRLIRFVGGDLSALLLTYFSFDALVSNCPSELWLEQCRIISMCCLNENETLQKIKVNRRHVQYDINNAELCAVPFRSLVGRQTRRICHLFSTLHQLIALLISQCENHCQMLFILTAHDRASATIMWHVYTQTNNKIK